MGHESFHLVMPTSTCDGRIERGLPLKATNMVAGSGSLYRG